MSKSPNDDVFKSLEMVVTSAKSENLMESRSMLGVALCFISSVSSLFAKSLIKRFQNAKG